MCPSITEGRKPLQRASDWHQSHANRIGVVCLVSIWPLAEKKICVSWCVCARKLRPHFPLFLHGIKVSVWVCAPLIITNAGTTEPKLTLMMFKGHASFSRHSAESPETAQSPPLKHSMLFSMLSIQMFRPTISCSSAVFSGEVSSKKNTCKCL